MPSPAPALAVPPLLRRVATLAILLALLSGLWCVLAKHLFGHSLSFFVPLPPHEWIFGDLTIYANKLHLLGTAAFFHTGFPFTYPAPVALLYAALNRLGHRGIPAYLLLFTLAALIPALVFARALARRISTSVAFAFTAVLLLTSWPLLTILATGNLEIFVWILLCPAFWAFSTGRLSLAATLFGLAASLKLFPFVFFALFLSTRDLRRLLLAIAVFFATSIAALWAVGPTIPIALHGIAAGLAFFKANYMAGWEPSVRGIDHSLFALVKLSLLALGRSPASFPGALAWFLPLSAVAGLLLYFLLLRRLPLLNQLLALTLVSIYLTAFSGDGTLVHLYGPFALLCLLAVHAHRANTRVPGLALTLLLLTVVLSPLSFLNTAAHFDQDGLRAILLGTLLFLSLRFPFGPPLALAPQFHPGDLPRSTRLTS